MTPAAAYDALRLERLHTAPPDAPPSRPFTPSEVEQHQRALIRQMVHAIATEIGGKP